MCRRTRPGRRSSSQSQSRRRPRTSVHDLHVLESSAALDVVRSSVEVEVDDHDVHGPTGPRLHCDHAAPGAAKVHRPAVDRPRLVRPTDGPDGRTSWDGRRTRTRACVCLQTTESTHAGTSRRHAGCSRGQDETPQHRRKCVTEVRRMTRRATGVNKKKYAGGRRR